MGYIFKVENEYDDDLAADGCLFELTLFGFATEPVELLLDKRGIEHTKFFFVSQLRLLLLLNPQKDLE